MRVELRILSWALWSGLLITACGEARGGEPVAGRAGSGAAGSGSLGGAGADDVPDLGPRGSDRCLDAASCGEAHLPPQPDVPWLGDAGDGWLRLIEADWELQPGSEGYRCVTRTVPEEVYIAAFSPLSPNGTHHTVVVVNRTPSGPDGVSVCGVLGGGELRLQGAGAGTEPSEMPPGVAMKVGAGTQLMMNLHLFNATDSVLRGTSGMRIKRLKKEQVKSEAEVRLIGPLSLQIPRGRVVQRGGCAMTRAATVFSVSPHMHQLGVHAKVIARRASGGDEVLYDAAYDFGHQYVYSIDEVQLAAGDRIDVECTYLNTTDHVVGWGDSSLSEMCFAGVGVYPSTGGGGLPCTM